MSIGLLPRTRPLLRAYMDRLGLDDSVLREDGRLRLRVDGCHGVDLLPVPGGGLVLLSDLADLSSWPRGHADEVLVHLLEMATGLLRDHASSLAIDAGRHRLQLQQVLPPQASVDDVEQALAGFLNLLPFWSQTCRQELESLSRSPWGIR